ncbi:MAG: hypothetical protein KKA07_05475 [Bacteroidetes bacterium]|nr:hypothetical protein [Bacteroidota bacterium]MBU1718504.1 hypothetical protein [Bacteroidota bacterium]
MNQAFQSIPLLHLLIKWKWHFLIFTIISVAAGIVFSSPMFITPEYRSNAIMYPSNLIPYSDETPTEQMLQLFHSEDVNTKCVDAMNLGLHYDLDTANRYYRTKVMREFYSNVTIRKTEFESVEIIAYDTDPDTACSIVTNMIALMNEKALGLLHDKAQEVVIIWEEQLIKKSTEIDSLKALIDSLRSRSKIVDFESQVKEASRQYFTMLRERGNPGQNDLTAFMKNLENKGSELFILTEILNATVVSYAQIKTNYDIAVQDLTKKLTYTNIVTNPLPADKKSYPIRWMIVAGFLISTWILLLSFLALYERTKIFLAENQNDRTTE